MAYGEPGTLRPARLPINAYHSAKKINNKTDLNKYKKQ